MTPLIAKIQAWLMAQRVRAAVVAAILVVTVALTPPDAERYGDRLQIALPLTALGCAMVNGQAGEYFVRFWVMLFSVHGTKRALAEDPLNIRPHGGRHGFPSAHTSAAVFGASSLIHDCVTKSPIVRGAVILSAGYVGASRIEANAHDIWQVLAGALAGWAADRAFRRNSAVRRGTARILSTIGGLITEASRRIYNLARGHLNLTRHRMLTARGNRKSGRRNARNILRAIALPLAFAVAAFGADRAQAQAGAGDWEISLYLGAQSAPHSDVEGDDPGGAGNIDLGFGWEGRSGEAPPYYGVRATYWWTETLGFGVEINHAKVYADDDSLAKSGFSRFEFTDGLNLVTANVFRRWPGEWGDGRLSPYVGAGAGVAVPHVDVESAGGKTFEYQLTGPAVVVMAGVSYAINDRWSIFGEYKGSYSSHDIDLDSGGSLETEIITNAINIGVGFNF